MSVHTSGIYVFLGPSLARREAERRAPAAAIFRPPAAMGDVYSAVTAGATVIGLIDGLFEGVPSVWHKEILFALSRGVRVVAGGSMGALRAAETHAFGTVGVGQIFAWYRDGVLEDDDEVAVAHGTAVDQFRTLSDAMVTLRWGLGLARDRQVIRADTHDRLIATAKVRHYPERSWQAVFEDGARLGVAAAELEDLRRFVAREKPDLKRQDALAVLEVVRRVAKEDAAARSGGKAGVAIPVAPSQTFQFEPTEFWHKLVDSERLVSLPAAAGRGAVGGKAGPAHAIRLQQVLFHTMLTAPDRDQLRAHALDLALRSAEMERRRPPLDVKAVARLARAASPSRRLMAPGDREEVATLDLARDALIPRLEGRFVRYVQMALAASGKLSGVVAEIARKHAFLRDRGTPFPVVGDTGLDARGLVRWYEGRFGRVRGPLGEHVTTLGFSSEDHFLGELAGEYLFDRDVRRQTGGPRARARRRPAKPARKPAPKPAPKPATKPAAKRRR